APRHLTSYNSSMRKRFGAPPRRRRRERSCSERNLLMNLLKWTALLGVAVCLLAAARTASVAQDKDKAKDEPKEVKTASGLKYVDLKEGTGQEAKKGDAVEVHYTGWLYEDGKAGKKFDSSVDRKQPFSFPLGAGRVIKGWDEGVAGMKVGGKRKL